MTTSKALEYTIATQTLLQGIVGTQMDKIERAAEIIADAIANDGLLYTFGTGHSHVIAEDVAYRAGGLAPVDAILEPSLTGHQQVFKSEFMERVEGMAEVILDYYEISSKDALVVISNSGRNAAPVEMAELAKARGVPVIAVTAIRRKEALPSGRCGHRQRLPQRRLLAPPGGPAAASGRRIRCGGYVHCARHHRPDHPEPVGSRHTASGVHERQH